MGFSILERRHLYIHMGPSIIIVFSESCDDDVIKLKHFQNYWPFGYRLPANSHYKGQWRGALMFSLICVLNKQSCGWWFKTPWRSLWRHCNVNHVFTRHALWVARAWDRSGSVQAWNDRDYALLNGPLTAFKVWHESAFGITVYVFECFKYMLYMQNTKMQTISISTTK